MGMMYANNQERAARHLLRVLEELGGRVHYGHFYDGIDATAHRLYAGMGLDDKDGEWIGAEGVMDQTAAAMEEQGFVRLVWLQGETLADGEPAYAIELTEEGRRKLDAGERPTFRDLCL